MQAFPGLVDLVAQLPEFSGQADPFEGGFGFGHRLRPPLRTQSVGVPFLGESPALAQRQSSAAWTIPLFAPAIDMLLRPEQKHSFSSEHDIGVPLARSQRKVNDSLLRQQLAVSHAQRHFVVAAATRGVNASVLVQHRGNAQSIPDAVAIPGMLANPHRKSPWAQRRMAPLARVLRSPGA